MDDEVFCTVTFILVVQLPLLLALSGSISLIPSLKPLQRCPYPSRRSLLVTPLPFLASILILSPTRSWSTLYGLPWLLSLKMTAASAFLGFLMETCRAMEFIPLKGRFQSLPASSPQQCWPSPFLLEHSASCDSQISVWWLLSLLSDFPLPFCIFRPPLFSKQRFSLAIFFRLPKTSEYF